MNKLDLYRIFNQVAISESFSKAARSLYMSQPAISQSILQLEEELGVRLFTRTHRGVLLTSEGKLLFQHVNAGISLIKSGEQKIHDSKNLIEGRLKIGVGDTILRYYLLEYLEKYHRLYPQIRLRIINRTTMELKEMVKSGDLDIAIINLPIEDKSLEIYKAKRIQDIFVAGSSYKGFTKKNMDIKDLVNYPLIMLDNRSRSRQYVESYFLSIGVKIDPEIELGSHDLLLEFAKAGLGIASVVKEYSMEHINSGSIYEINTKGTIPQRNIGVCHLKDVSLSPSARKFLDILLKSEKM